MSPCRAGLFYGVNKTYRMKLAAHSVKPGDTIKGVEVFDTIRPGFGGYYIPLIDGSRITVRRVTDLVKID